MPTKTAPAKAVPAKTAPAKATKAAPATKAVAVVTPEVVEQAKAKRQMISHAECDHPRTPAGRAACRAERKAAAA